MKASIAGDPGGELVVSTATRGTFSACCAGARRVAAATNRPAMRSRRLICPPCRMLRHNWTLSYHVVWGEECQGSQHLALSRYPPAVFPRGQKRTFSTRACMSARLLPAQPVDATQA